MKECCATLSESIIAGRFDPSRFLYGKVKLSPWKCKNIYNYYLKNVRIFEIIALKVLNCKWIMDIL